MIAGVDPLRVYVYEEEFLLRLVVCLGVHQAAVAIAMTFLL